MRNRRLAELAGLVHRSTVEEPKALNESTRERNKFARRQITYGQDSSELESLRQRFSKEEVIEQWDLFWNEETKSWFHEYWDRNGKRDAYDTRVGDPLDPWRAALAADGVSSEADFLRASGQMGAMMESRLLLEEEEEGGDEGGGLDLFGDDDEGDDKKDESGDDEEKDDAAGDDEEEGEEDKEEAPKEEPAEELKPKDIAKYGPGEIDTEIDSVISDIFSNSSMKAKVSAKTSLGYPGSVELEESFRRSMKNRSMSFLLEETAPPSYENFDIVNFTDEIARYINNYQSLLDIEGMLFNKARQFLLNRPELGKPVEEKFIELLATKHGLDFKEDFSGPSAAFGPTAVGASGGAGA